MRALALALLVAAVPAAAADFTIVPGRRVGPIGPDTSERQLVAIYGARNVRAVEIEVGEGATVPGTVLFPADDVRRAWVFWRDPAQRLHPRSVAIRGERSRWKTDRGITLGMPLAALEALNGRPLLLTGFWWDYGGTLLDCLGGRLAELGTQGPRGLDGRTLVVRVAPGPSPRGSAEEAAVAGDRAYSSDLPAMRKLAPRVYELIAILPER